MDNRKELIEKIIDELNGRSGFDDWWCNIDEDTQEEITETLVNILPIPVVVGQSEQLNRCKHKGRRWMPQIAETYCPMCREIL